MGSSQSKSKKSPLKPPNIGSYSKHRNIENNISKSTLLLYGYIHIIQNLMQNNIIIPNEIYTLCHSYYHKSDPDFIFCKQKQPRSNLGFFDIKNKRFSIIQLNKLKESDENFISSAICHIPNISNVLSLNGITNNAKLNAIFAVYGPKAFHNYWAQHYNKPQAACLILYAPSISYDGGNTIIAKHELKSNKLMNFDITVPTQFLHCNDDDTIIYEDNAKLYQLNLHHVKQLDDLVDFKELKQNNKQFTEREDYRQWLNMIYLANKRSIFGMQCSAYYGFRCESPMQETTLSPPTLTRQYTAKCGIFSLNDNKWRDIKPYKYNIASREFVDDFCGGKLCYDDLNNDIYVMSRYNLSKFDCTTNKWYILNRGYTYGPKLWIDGSILYLLSSHYNRNNSNKFELYSLDLRSNNKQWIADNIQFDGLNNDKNQRFQFL